MEEKYAGGLLFEYPLILQMFDGVLTTGWDLSLSLESRPISDTFVSEPDPLALLPFPACGWRAICLSSLGASACKGAAKDSRKTTEFLIVGCTAVGYNYQSKRIVGFS